MRDPIYKKSRNVSVIQNKHFKRCLMRAQCAANVRGNARGIIINKQLVILYCANARRFLPRIRVLVIISTLFFVNP